MTYLIKGIECRTREESLRHIAQQAKLKKIGPKTEKDETYGCEYEYPSGNNCAVGSLFSKAQLKDIRAQHANGTSIGYLAKYQMGVRNIETVTGMKIEELEILQRIHDDTLNNHNPQAARDGVRIYCEKELEKLKNQPQKKPRILRAKAQA
jgi:hypothetical protein